MRSIHVVLALLLAAGTAGCAPRVADYDEPGAELGPYGEWDADRSGVLDENELADAYDAWDTDADGLLSEEEFGMGRAAWLGDSQIGDFQDWDVDGDGLLDDDEFYDGLSELGV